MQFKKNQWNLQNRAFKLQNWIKRKVFLYIIIPPPAFCQVFYMLLFFSPFLGCLSFRRSVSARRNPFFPRGLPHFDFPHKEKLSGRYSFRFASFMASTGDIFRIRRNAKIEITRGTIKHIAKREKICPRPTQ